MRQVPKKLFPLFSVILFDQTSVSLMFPMLTFVFFDQSSSLFSPDASHAVRSLLYGLSIALANCSSILIASLLSLLSDQQGRKKTLILALASALVCAIFSAISILIGAVVLLLIGRCLSGCSARSITSPIAQAIVADITENKHKITHMGYLQFIISVGAFLGPLIAGYFAKSLFFAQLNFSLPFFIAAGFSIIAILFTFNLLQESFSTNIQQPLAIKEAVKLLHQPNFLQLSIFLFLMQISWSTYYQFVPPLLKTTFQFTPATIGLFVGLIAFWLALATLFGLRAVKTRCNEQQIVRIGAYLILTGFISLFLAILLPHNIIAEIFLWLSGAIISMGDVLGYCALITLYSNSAAANNQGKVMGLSFIIVTITWAITALGGGALAALHTSLPLLCAPCGILTLIFLNKKIYSLK